MAEVNPNLNAPLMVGQPGTSLSCDVSGAADSLNPMITYQWTRNGDVVQDGSLSTLILSSLRLSQAGVYTCRATVSSILLNNDIQKLAGNTRTVTIESELTNPMYTE